MQAHRFGCAWYPGKPATAADCYSGRVVAPPSAAGRGYPRLLGDIGGTHARWAWQDAGDPAPGRIVVHRCVEHASLLDSARRYLDEQGLGEPAAAAVGVATPVTGDEVRMTNHPWAFSISALQRALGVGRLVVINDFTALALSVPALGADDLRALGGGSAALDGAIAVIGPGTGLGVSGLVPDGRGDWVPLAGEGGHVTLAAADDVDAALLARLRARFGHVSAERVVSGPGLAAVYAVLCERDGATVHLADAPAIAAAAGDGSDARAVEAVHRFTGFLGNVAGNLALTLGARGGVYLGGGVVPRLGRAFDAAWFRRRFEDKGRFAGYLREIPTWLITAATPALLGASRALDRPAR